MSGKRYGEEFKREVIKQSIEGEYAVADVARRLGTTTHSLYAWLKKYGHQARQTGKNQAQREGIKCFNAELKGLPKSEKF